MTNKEALLLSINLHTRTVIGLLDAVERAADDPAKRVERLAMIRDAVLEFKTDVMLPIIKELP